MGTATGHPASIAFFKWSPAHISVSNIMDFLRDFIVTMVFIYYGQFMGTGVIVCPSFLFWLGITRMLCPCFDHVCSFQAILHHCFVCLMKHIAANLQREKVYSLELTTTSVRRGLSICFWEGKEMVPKTIAHCGRDVPSVKSSLLLCSQVLSAVSMEPTIIRCAGGSGGFIKPLDKASSQKTRLQYPFNLLPLQIEKLKHKPNFSVMGKIDMFSMVRTLLVWLCGIVDEKWTQSTQNFRNVR